MSEAVQRRRLAVPTVSMLPRAGDSLSFLYLDIVRVEQDDTGVCAVVETPERGREVVYLPTAALSCVLLGPGTSITAPAQATLGRHGTTVVTTGSGGVRCYASSVPGSLTTKWLEIQARAWAGEESRLAVATRMYEKRFGESGLASSEVSLARLRGLEGARMKALYRTLAKHHRIARFRRSYNPADFDDQDPVNKALSSASACLYGIVHATVNALGCSAGLGFIHEGNQQAFVYDIADLYKAELTIPLAFSLHASTDPEGEARRHFRQKLHLFRLMPRIVRDIQEVLRPDGVEEEDTGLRTKVVDLWDPVVGSVPGATNYAGDLDDDE
ncbi:type I-E CRISPR-associated endonuclease Cas1e [Actinoalloteichus caeruleus]|uniref:type I-E CRISPR-associated endonuclease Cas1e n=1 Tax=Actinoalloteichus cyanogriseus TaxID=2893586 RepID=UPI003AAA9059